jgi:hypothetical protein
MDMDIDRTRENNFACTVDRPVCRLRRPGMDNATVPDRDIHPAPVRELDVYECEVQTGFHADMIGSKP